MTHLFVCRSSTGRAASFGPDDVGTLILGMSSLPREVVAQRTEWDTQTDHDISSIPSQGRVAAAAFSMIAASKYPIIRRLYSVIMLSREKT
jgi:hypothetical protein